MHAGIEYKAGDIIELDDDTADWLMKAHLNLRKTKLEELQKVEDSVNLKLKPLEEFTAKFKDKRKK